MKQLHLSFKFLNFLILFCNLIFHLIDSLFKIIFPLLNNFLKLLLVLFCHFFLLFLEILFYNFLSNRQNSQLILQFFLTHFGTTFIFFKPFCLKACSWWKLWFYLRAYGFRLFCRSELAKRFLILETLQLLFILLYLLL